MECLQGSIRDISDTIVVKGIADEGENSRERVGLPV